MTKLPQAFLDHVAAFMPDHLTLDDFVTYSDRPLRRAIRVNTLKISIKEFVERMGSKGWKLTPVPWCEEGFWIEWDDAVSLGNTMEHLAGLFYIQEASSMMPPAALLAEDDMPQRVLDVASAPGSKTTQMAARLGNTGVIIANEYSASRIKGLHANLQRLGIRNVALTHFDGRVFGPTLPEAFDAILLDAPCSGEGTVRKDPEALSNWSPESTAEIAAVQRDLIESAFAALKPGGRLVYSTCALSLEENQAVCHFLKDKYPDQVEFIALGDLFPDAEKALTEEGFLHIWPQIYDSEGFFVAAIRKTGSIETEVKKYRQGKFPFQKAKADEHKALAIYLDNQFGMSLPEQGQLMQRDQELWWFPEGIDDFIGTIRMNRLGMKLAEQHKKGYKPSHETVMALPFDADKSVELTEDDAEQYLMGRDVRPDAMPGKGEVIVTLDGAPLGMAKWVGSRLKNALPRELVRDKISR